MLSFQTLYSDVQSQVSDTSSTSLILIKRWINQGAKKFGAKLNREWRRSSRTQSTVANQQYYYLPVDCIRPKSITVTIGGVAYPLTQIDNEEDWNDLNQLSTSSDIPEFFFVRGGTEFGIYPIPSSSTANAITVRYERRMRDMSADDYTTGTITATNGDETITGAGTTFTAVMVGRWLRINDPNGDGMWYQIASYTSATSIELTTKYQGTTGASLSYTIGEMPDIPEEYHENLVDYACYRYYKRRKDRGMSRDFGRDFETALLECQSNYSSTSASQYTRAKRHAVSGYVHVKRNLSIT